MERRAGEPLISDEALLADYRSIELATDSYEAPITRFYSQGRSLHSFPVLLTQLL